MQKVVLVGNKSIINKSINPITGEELFDYDYYYITKGNRTFKILTPQFPDSVSVLPNQQELIKEYSDTSFYFKILFQDKIFLMNKNGLQLSQGFDNIYFIKQFNVFVTETYTQLEGITVRMKGMINRYGKQLIPCKYKAITISTEDSTLYCCSAVFNNKLNDDVFDLAGKLIYTNKNHIEFSTKTMHVYKKYEPKTIFMIENDLTKESFGIEGTAFYYIKNNIAIIIQNTNWYAVNLITNKKTKINKALYYSNLYYLLGI